MGEPHIQVVAFRARREQPSEEAFQLSLSKPDARCEVGDGKWVLQIRFHEFDSPGYPGLQALELSQRGNSLRVGGDPLLLIDEEPGDLHSQSVPVLALNEM